MEKDLRKKELNANEFDLEVELLDLDEVSAIPETTASSGSTSCSASSTCGSTSCCGSC
ncbi:thiazolylpeptide-type bacteriocin [Lysinibacillus fusiformis]|jgi:thiazolylpeptide-type bacteriocin precursor|uniref:thiazolylpeptide-type bacteriocin n=1 Tax=Lysinibacillus TaxID=400634 RepID=UPI0009B8C812|nr:MULTISPECIES: thiazolylpeptide-type bacteriocin [Lysinibacillus]KAB0443279.1 thiazolylpeptide-type bacteriocin [Lysinibacillus fusiformis]MCE4044805.1 thiazolylpeptide-type bacteriocin [Lysinibacillus fusiformis]MCK1988459.1 thiazolylpeptide-type bacteriocin [Lysinibacillus fusiformis]MCT6815559.1 thiazolylpeptide-type bacteriocin [Lysinibacillus fusiformis]MCT6926619.1 thiazolylpeptide-type bacteriocin [Lysinibacillus fusiformis]